MTVLMELLLSTSIQYVGLRLAVHKQRTRDTKQDVTTVSPSTIGTNGLEHHIIISSLTRKRMNDN